MTCIESVVSEHLEKAFTISIPAAQRVQLDGLPATTRHTLLGEIFRLAAQAGQERELLPRYGPVTLEFLLAGCDVNLELDAPGARLTLVSLVRAPH